MVRGVAIPVVTIVALLVIVIGFFEGRKAYLDSQVREMCAKDGGIKVYEAVRLTDEKYAKLLDKFGRLSIPRRSSGTTNQSADSEYYMEWKVTYIQRGNPELSRDHFMIIRSADGKLLGESVYYGRGGGDLPGPWHESSFICPNIGAQKSLESSIFSREDAK